MTNLNARVKKAHQGDPLTPLIDRWLVERKEDPTPFIPPNPGPRRPGRFSPSNMKCLRAGVMNFMGVPGKRVITPELQTIFDVGNWLHWMWFTNFLAMEKHFGPEVFQVISIETNVGTPEWWMAGRFDILVSIKGNLYLIDIKTINDNGFTTRINERAPQRDHIAQLISYLRSERVARGLLFYFNKNDQRFKVFKVNFNKALWKQSLKWLKRGQRHLRVQQVPPRHEDCTRDSNMARNCPYSHLCYGGKSPTELQAIIYEGKPPAEEMWLKNNAEVL